MAEEETTVAKAFVGTENDVVEKKQNVNDIDYGKTQVVPTIPKELLKDDEYEEDPLLEDDDYSETEENKIPEDDGNISAKKKKNDKKKKIIIVSVAAAVAVIAIITIIIVVSASNKKKKQSYDYYYNQGMKLYEEGNYGDAAGMLSKASKDAKGKKNLDLKYTLFK